MCAALGGAPVSDVASVEGPITIDVSRYLLLVVLRDVALEVRILTLRFHVPLGEPMLVYNVLVDS